CANEHLRLRRPSPRRDALRPSRRLTAEAVVARDAPGRRLDPPARLLPRRVRVQVQPADVGKPRPALLPADGAGGRDDTEAREDHHWRTALERPLISPDLQP